MWGGPLPIRIANAPFMIAEDLYWREGSHTLAVKPFNLIEHATLQTWPDEEGPSNVWSIRTLNRFHVRHEHASMELLIV